jgi:enterochelin esterase-like enzyme
MREPTVGAEPKKMVVIRAAVLLTAATLAASAQAPAPVVSPEIHNDKSVTFRFHAPNAREVFLAREGAERTPLRQDATGIWTITTGPLEPDIYAYSFLADGVSLLDPSNPRIKLNLLQHHSVLHVPGPASLPWEIGDVPRGTVHRHFYRSAIIGDDRDYYVYTPPGYDPGAGTRYPALYLLHGFSDDSGGWTSFGLAHVILDNLISQGRAKPMIVVMPLGYGVPEIVTRNGLRSPDLRQKNYDKFRDALFAEVIPEIEKTYRVSKNRQFRAIAGLSMGGAESLYVGLNALDRFAWIGSFSAGGLGEDFDAMFPSIGPQVNARLNLLWIACGTEDRLIDSNRQFQAWLKSKGVEHEAIEMPGIHSWRIWRRNLASFVPLLFQSSASARVHRNRPRGGRPDSAR